MNANIKQNQQLTSSNWWFNGKEVLSTNDIPATATGFIYLITQKSTGKLYIGRKLLTRAASKQIDGKKKKIRKESDWLSYWSSSPKIKSWIDESGTDDFTREILAFASTNSQLLYLEECLLYHTDALLNSKYLNDNIRSKVMRKWFEHERNIEFKNDISKIKSKFDK